MHFNKYLIVTLGFFATFVASAPVGFGDNDSDAIVAREPVNPKHMAQAVGIANRIRHTLRPRPNGAVFWSGTKTGKNGPVSVKADAQKFAKKTGKETINMALKKQGIKIPTPKQNPLSNRIWDVASRAWALRAKGDTHAVLGGKVRPGSVWNKIERPTLMKNKNVHKLCYALTRHLTIFDLSDYGFVSYVIV